MHYRVGARVFAILGVLFTISIPSSFAIIGGTDAKIEEFPWHVSIQVKEQNSSLHNCGGSIIAPNIILTAEHCMVFANLSAQGKPIPQKKDHYIVKAGITDWRETTPATSEIKATALYEKYEKFSGYDVALVVLDQCLEYKTNIQPIEIANDEQDAQLTQSGAKINAIGWGMSAYPDTYPFILQKAALHVHDQATATSLIAGTMVADFVFKIFNSFEFPMSTLIAAGGTGTDTGTKDSGGSVSAFDPVTQKPLLLGITSWGNGKTGGYVRASHFKSWIDQKVQKYSKKCR